MIKNQQYYLDNFNRYIDNRLLEINAIILLITYSIYGIPSSMLSMGPINNVSGVILISNFLIVFLYTKYIIYINEFKLSKHTYYLNLDEIFEKYEYVSITPLILCDVLINKEGYKYAIKGYPNSNAIYLHKEAINDTPDNVIRMGLYSEYYAYKSFGE